MGSSKKLWQTALVGLAWLVVGCREPTQITVEITTDALCEDLNETAVSVGSLSQLPERSPSTITTRCTNGRVGAIVLVPSGDKDESVAIQIVSALGDETAETCAASGFTSGCIVARRALRYYPHESLTLPVALNLSCKDLPCDALQTCFDGRCVDSVLPDARGCTTPGGCGSTGNGDADASVGGMGGSVPMGGSGGTTGSGGASMGGQSGSMGSGGASGGTAGSVGSGGATGGDGGASGGTGGSPTGGTGGASGGTGGAATGGSGGGTGGSGGAPGTECTDTSDCKLYSSYCISDPCACIPMPANVVDPKCLGMEISCTTDPCTNDIPLCENGYCTKSSGANL